MSEENPTKREIAVKKLLTRHYYAGGLPISEIVKRSKMPYGTFYQILRKIGFQEGCFQNDKKHPYVGRQIGILTVIQRSEQNCFLWKCACECGGERTLTGPQVSGSKIRHCGCRGRSNAWKGYGEISGVYWASIRKGAEGRKLSVTVTIEEAWDKFEQQGRRCALRRPVANKKPEGPGGDRGEDRVARPDRLGRPLHAPEYPMGPQGNQQDEMGVPGGSLHSIL